MGSKVVINEAALVEAVGKISKTALRRAARRLAQRAADNVIAAGRVSDGIESPIGKNGPTQPGTLAASFKTRDMTTDPLHPTVRVYTTVPYARFQEFGTKAHGPVRAPYLVFRPKFAPAGTRVFAKWVRGVTPAHFMLHAAQATRASDFRP